MYDNTRKVYLEANPQPKPPPPPKAKAKAKESKSKSAAKLKSTGDEVAQPAKRQSIGERDE